MPRGIPKLGFRKSRKSVTLPAESHDLASGPIAVATTETDEQIGVRLNRRFEALATMAAATVEGHARSLIVSGPPGLGKSYGVEQVLANCESKGYVAGTVKGFVRPTGLYKMLYQYRFENCVVVFDDADSVFGDEASLNLLKAACDTNEDRNISWMAETRMEDEDGFNVPRSFKFAGSVIFITNYDFDAAIARGHRLAPHFAAMVSRSHYLDLTLKTTRDYLVRIKQVVNENGMLRKEGHNAQTISEILAFIEENHSKLRELSLRLVKKISGIVKMSPNNWKDLVEQTCFRNSY